MRKTLCAVRCGTRRRLPGSNKDEAEEQELELELVYEGLGPHLMLFNSRYLLRIIGIWKRIY